MRRFEIFLARDLIPSRQHLDEDEYVDVQPCDLEELKEKIFAGQIEDAKTIAALLAYEAKYLERVGAYSGVPDIYMEYLDDKGAGL